MASSLTFAFVVGMLATVNPCGFALLPAYLAVFVGLDGERPRRHAVGRAFAVSGVLTLGFITVFGLVGIVFGSLFGSIKDYLPWVTMVVGLVLMLLGLWLVSGHELVVSIPKLQKGGSDGTLLSMYLFGVSYALASMSCAIAPFLTVTSTAIASSRSGPLPPFVNQLLSFVAYGLGMGVVIAVLTVAVALARKGLVTWFRQLIPMVNRIAGGIMVVVGAYIAYYGLYEVRTLVFGQEVSDPIIDTAFSIQAWLVARGPNTSNVWLYLVTMVLGLTLAAAGVAFFVALVRRIGQSRPAGES